MLGFNWIGLELGCVKLEVGSVWAWVICVQVGPVQVWIGSSLIQFGLFGGLGLHQVNKNSGLFRFRSSHLGFRSLLNQEDFEYVWIRFRPFWVSGQAGLIRLWVCSVSDFKSKSGKLFWMCIGSGFRSFALGLLWPSHSCQLYLCLLVQQDDKAWRESPGRHVRAPPGKWIIRFGFRLGWVWIGSYSSW